MTNERSFGRFSENHAAPAYHGAFNYAELERLNLNPDEVLDFSVNSNPYGPSPSVLPALATVPVDRYPDREAIALRRALAAQLNIGFENIVIGNGTAELFWLLAFVTLSPGNRVLIVGPTFGEYSRVSAIMGAEIIEKSARPGDFAVNAGQIALALRETAPKLAFVCNPNNPTGQALPVEQLAGWAGQQPDTLFVVDESYLGFAPAMPSALTVQAANILVIRSMTKDYALAGLRLGYAAGVNRPLVEAIASVRPAWNVNGLAQAAGLAAMRDEAYMQNCLSKLYCAKSQLVAGLTKLGFNPLPSATHYFLLSVPEGAARFRMKLLAHNIMVRDCTSFGLPDTVRIATRREEDNERLLAAVMRET